MQEPVTLRGRAKKMRSEMTQPERELWTQLRGKRFVGVKFYRQFIIDPYIVDFAARVHRLVIEVDGDTHIHPEKDVRRTIHIERQGCRVIRFNNSDVMANIDGVMSAIGDALGHSLPLSQTLSLKGEGLSA